MTGGAGGERPNIVFILADDQGAWAMGCAGNPEIRTPHLDRLAAEGIRFDNFFCTSPVCSPARASLLTGRIPSQHGVHDWIREGNTGPEAVEYLQGQTAYTDIMAEHGYICGLSGKWHLGDSLKPQKGFSHWYAHQTGGGNYYGAPMIRDGVPVTEPGYVTEAITDDALEFLDAHAGGAAPFYLSVHYTAPHSPWIDNHPQHIVDSYNDCAFASCPQEPPHPWSLPSTVPADVRTRTRDNLQGYFAAVTAMDEQIGRIANRLEQLGLRERTLIVFTSDNGFNCGHHGIWGKGNGTFPQNMYDTSVKVPFIWSHPGRSAAGMVCGELLSGYDVMPTLLEYAGLPQPDAVSLPGRSFAGLTAEEEAAALRTQEDASSETGRPVVVYDEYGPVRMVRTKSWKYVHRYPYGPHELYDLSGDPGETDNKAGRKSFQDIETQLRAELEEWFARYVNPQLDGVREAVTGKGQLYLAGTAAKGRRAFHELE
ncbi:sulfatase-like hydrolase/transferase [Paenibacillus thalictri]|uniref:Sulfatase n=1 Tax=Paenibacillus thalictri TaxID=2527873 RepID=A0A4Q9DKQ1_9BACL|nr:sulfatase-like hydrolase/transferase [Paenibacillus thalictri]TBL72729.1 sulfatase [Paenibacillus thalictri]